MRLPSKYTFFSGHKIGMLFLFRNYLVVLLLVLSHGLAGQIPPPKTKVDFNDLLSSLWENPIAFDRHGKLTMLIDSIDKVSQLDLVNFLNKIYADGLIANESKANEGMMGSLNRKSTNRRNKKFIKQMKDGFRDKEKFPTHKVILADGDSWFQFPVFLKDIVDQLNERDDYAIASLAKGGDWLSNIIKNNSYLKSYVQLRPEVMLISGGGNDIVQERLSSLVDRPENIELSTAYMQEYTDYLITRLTDLTDSPNCNGDCHMPSEIKNELDNRRDSLVYDQQLVETLLRGRKFLNDRFYVLLTLHKLQYYLVLESLKKADEDYFSNELTIIVQGYDYTIPRFNKGPRLGQRIVNSVTDHGDWLALPLMTKGIINATDQRAVMTTIIFEFNEMLLDVISDPRFDYAKIFLIDCRGAIEKLSYLDRRFFWFDELHPSSSIFKEIAGAYMQCIDGKQKDRIYRLADRKMPAK